MERAVLVILLQIIDAGVKRGELGVDVGMESLLFQRSSWKLMRSATLRTASSNEIFSYFSTKVMALPPVPQTKHLKICFSFRDVERRILVVVERAERNVAPAFLGDGDISEEMTVTMSACWQGFYRSGRDRTCHHTPFFISKDIISTNY
jgi:hypothetical protein